MRWKRAENELEDEKYKVTQSGHAEQYSFVFRCDVESDSKQPTDQNKNRHWDDFREEATDAHKIDENENLKYDDDIVCRALLSFVWMFEWSKYTRETISTEWKVLQNTFNIIMCKYCSFAISWREVCVRERWDVCRIRLSQMELQQQSKAMTKNTKKTIFPFYSLPIIVFQMGVWTDFISLPASFT